MTEDNSTQKNAIFLNEDLKIITANFKGNLREFTEMVAGLNNIISILESQNKHLTDLVTSPINEIDKSLSIISLSTEEIQKLCNHKCDSQQYLDLINKNVYKITGLTKDGLSRCKQ